MKNLNTTRRLTHTLVLLAALSAGQIQATETLQVAENGAERALERSRKLHHDSAAKLAENGSERALQRSHKLQHENAVELAENGSEYALVRSRRV